MFKNLSAISQTIRKAITVTNILWLVYFALLVVLLPHLAWMANRFEPSEQEWVGWAFAIAFELTVAAFTHKLKQHIEKMPRSLKAKGWKNSLARFWYQTGNPFSLGLLFFVSVSALGNLAHAWEFGKENTVAIFSVIPFSVFAVMFGGALPLANLLFARVLSEVSETEDEPNPEVEELKKRLKELRSTLAQAEEVFRSRLAETEQKFAQTEQELRSQLAETERKAAQTEQVLRSQLSTTERALADAEDRLGEVGQALTRLFGESKADRIIAAYELWKGRLKSSTIADLAESSPSHVSEILKRVNGHQPVIEGEA
jgi:hypothetical protein